MLVSSMLKKWPITFILLGVLCSSAQAQQDSPDCTQILQEVESDPTLNLESYLHFLLENKIISLQGIQKFYDELQINKLSNPIPHQSTSYGPVFSSSQLRDHYFRFESLISNKDEFNLDSLKQHLKKELENQGIKLKEKSVISQSSNYEFYVTHFQENYFNKELSEDNFLEKDLHVIASKTFDLFIKNLANSSDRKDQYLANLFQAMQINRFDYVQAQKALNDDENQRALTYYFIDDNSKEFTEFTNTFLEKYISILKQKKRHSYHNTEIYKRIKNAKQEYLPNLEFLLLHTFIQSEDFHQLVKLYARYGGKKQIDFLKNLSTHEELKSRGLLLSIIYSSLLKLGEIDFVIKSIKYNRIYDYYNYEWIFEDIEKMPEDLALKVIKQGLQSSDLKMQYTLADKLALIKTSNALKLKKEMFSFLPTRRQLVLKLKMISGIEEDWAIDLIMANLQGADNHIQRAALSAFKGGSSTKTRDLIEKIYNDYEADYFGEKFILESLANRPIEDLLYFIKKYKGEEISYACLEHMTGHYSPEAVELATGNPPITQKEIPIRYLESLPLEKTIDAWKKLIKDKYASKDAIKNFYGATDPESLTILRNAINSTNEYIKKAAYDPYAYAYFYFLEKSQSSDLSEKKQAIEALNFLIK